MSYKAICSGITKKETITKKRAMIKKSNEKERDDKEK